MTPGDESIHPTLFTRRDGTAVRATNLAEFLAWDLSVERLNSIRKHLWLAGRPTAARPLSHQIALGRNLVLTEQADLHLVWASSNLFLKPLPAYLFRLERLAEHRSALSLLVSYVWLVRHQSDFSIAKKAGLIPATIGWKEWTEVCSQQFDNLNRFDLLEPRYQYGELRLARLNWICIATRNSGLRGYSFGQNRFANFLVENFGWLAGAFAYMSIVLNAMQVGLGTSATKDNGSFQNASFGFSVLALVSALVVAVAILGLLLIIPISNVRWAYENNRHIQQDRGLLKSTRSGKSKGAGLPK